VFRAVLLLAATLACAGRPSSTEGGSVRRDPNVILADELSETSLAGMNVLEVVRRLRPNFLATRGVQSQSNPESGRVHASINGNGVVSLDELRTMQTAGVVEIRLLSVAAAMQRFGGAAQEGPVILVRTI